MNWQKKHGLSIIDIFELSQKNQHLLCDGVHFTEKGYEILAKMIVDKVKCFVNQGNDK